jgi:glycine cleavage system transcriptional repressor
MTTPRHVAVTVIGNDRPGIVAAVARTLYDAGCNLEDVTSTILRGHFAMMLFVRVPDDLNASDLEERLDPVGKEMSLVVTARAVGETPVEVPAPTHIVSVYGSDQPGIVYRVAELLARDGANVTDLTSRVIGSEEHPVYALMLEVALPASSDEIERDLSSLKSELGVEVTVRLLETDLL